MYAGIVIARCQFSNSTGADVLGITVSASPGDPPVSCGDARHLFSVCQVVQQGGGGLPSVFRFFGGVWGADRSQAQANVLQFTLEGWQPGTQFTVMSDGAPCTIGGVGGTFGYMAKGFSLSNPSAGGIGSGFFNLFAAAGEFTLDGAGGLQVTDTISVNGNIFRQTNYSGRYRVNPNCTGTLTFNSGVFRAAYDLTITDGGARMLLVDTDQGSSISGAAER